MPWCIARARSGPPVPTDPATLGGHKTSSTDSPSSHRDMRLCALSVPQSVGPRLDRPSNRYVSPPPSCSSPLDALSLMMPIAHRCLPSRSASPNPSMSVVVAFQHGSPVADIVSERPRPRANHHPQPPQRCWHFAIGEPAASHACASTVVPWRPLYVHPRTQRAASTGSHMLARPS